MLSIKDTWLAALLWAAAASSAAHAYPVGPPIPLEKSNAEADIIFKGTVDQNPSAYVRE